MQGLTYEIKQAGEYVIENVKNTKAMNGKSELVLRSSQNIYLHYMSKGLMYSGGDNMNELKLSLLNISNELLGIMGSAKEKIKEASLKFLRNRTKILIFGCSSVVVWVLTEALKQGINLQLYIAECRPKGEGLEAYERLSNVGYPCKLIFDTAIAYALEECDMVLVGAEAVVENGGIINRVDLFKPAPIQRHCVQRLQRSHSMCLQRVLNLRDSSLCPKKICLSQYSIVKRQLKTGLRLQMQQNTLNPLCDYTPPELITLLFTDVGTFTPSAVSEELIQIFNA